MPRLPIDYSNTTFYRIVCNDLNITDCYIGHTTNFIKRKQHHKKDCNNEKSKSYNLKVYQFIRENGGWFNWSMVMIDQISCENLNDACKLERKFLEEYKGTLNSYIPSRTDKEYYIDNIDKIKKYQKENYQLNKDIINEKYKEYYNKNFDKIKEKKKEYQELNKDKIKEQTKEWKEQNKDKIKEYQKEYKELNKDKIKEQKKENYQLNKYIINEKRR